MSIRWQMWYSALVDADPGWLRFKQAFKVVVAFLLTAGVSYTWLDQTSIVFGCMVATFTSLCHEGDRRQSQQLSMALAGLSYTAAVGLGAIFSTASLVANILLIVLCFVAFYVQRFGSRYQLFPVIAAVIFLLGTILPSQSTLNSFYGALLGFFVAFLVYFYFWPDRSKVETRHYIIIVFVKYVKCLRLLRAGVNSSHREAYYLSLQAPWQKLEKRVRQQLDRLNTLHLPLERMKRAECLYIQLYAMYKVIGTMLESLLQLARRPHDEFETIRPVFDSLMQQFQAGFTHLYQLFLLTPDMTDFDWDGITHTHAELQRLVFEQKVPALPVTVHYSNLVFSCQRLIELMLKVESVLKERLERLT